MKRATVLCAVLSILVQIVGADTRSDILGLTGNARTKLIWVRFPWCDDNYNPVQSYSTDKDLYNEDAHTQLMAFDTDQGTPRYLDETIGSHCYPRLTHKDGSFVVWTDKAGKAAWIRDFAGTSSKRKLLDGGDYLVVACRWDPAANVEYVYAESQDETKLYRIPLKSDYTADLAQKSIAYQSSVKFDRGRVSVSRDGSYMGCSLPWPECMIVNLSTNQKLSRRAPGAFGCEPNLAPDNSYRFYHLRDDHQVIRMWDANLATTFTDFPINIGMPGVTFPVDCVAPRWTNNPRFFTNSYSLLYGFEINWDKWDIFAMNATQVKAADPAKAGTFCFGKFAADFKSVEKYVKVSDGDIRHRDVVGDAWVSGTPTTVGEEGAPRSRFAAPVAAIVRGRTVELRMSSLIAGSVILIGSSGRVVHSSPVTGPALLRLDHAPAGPYLLKIMAGERASETRIVLTR